MARRLRFVLGTRNSCATLTLTLFLFAVFHCAAPTQGANALSTAGNQYGGPMEDAAATDIIQGVCYSPFHNTEYPLGTDHPGNVAMLSDAIYKDFSVMRNFFTVVRTYYTSYYGVPVTPAAAANGVKLYLGVYMTNEAWYSNQVDDAITAIKNYPDTIAAILVGNENVQPAGPYTAGEISARISAIRARVKAETGRNVPIGTVQRATEWLVTGDRNAIAALADNCDIIGVNIYPFFDGNYNPQYPLAILNGIWDQMVNTYPVAKLRLTEIGFPTAGAPSKDIPNNIPSLANSKAFYNAYLNWKPSQGGGEAFWFMFFDRAPEDNSMGIELEKYFGFYTWDRASKAAGYPALTTAQALSPVSTPSPVALGPIPTKVIQGVCYSPFHNTEYPLGTDHPGNVAMLSDAIYKDFSVMRNFFTVVRTYYTSYYGVPVTPAAAANGVKLYLGVYMTNEAWYSNQVDDAITAIKNYPDTIAAILVGNENVQPAGPYTAGEISARISAIRARVKAETGRNVPIGTVQRATEWLVTGDRNAIAALADNCDIIGVNIYPFFDGNYNPQYPLAILNGIWDQMVNTYPVAKLRLTEIGFPTAGAPSKDIPNNIPSLANSKAFYNAYLNWKPSQGGGEAFWFMFFDRAPEDNSVGIALERYFGFYTWDRASKAAGYPALMTALAQTSSPSASSSVATTVSTPAPTTAKPTAAPVTQTPSPTTKASTTPSAPTITIPSIASANVCRVKKLFILK